MNECKLCGFVKPLKNSHIIPKTYFTRLKRTGPALEGNQSILIKNEVTQDSWSEKLLCHDCEQRVSSWENYGVEVFQRPHRHKITVRRSENEWEYFNIDFTTFRLFQLSVLFRSAVSSRKEFLSVTLSDEEVNSLRNVLNSHEEPTTFKFPCLMELIYSPNEDGNLYTEVLKSPDLLEVSKRRYYWFMFGGVCWYFVFPGLSNEETSYQSYLHYGGYMKLPALHFYEHPFIFEMAVSTAVKDSIGWTQ